MKLMEMINLMKIVLLRGKSNFYQGNFWTLNAGKRHKVNYSLYHIITVEMIEH